ncbi:hypothetical protein OJE16_23260 [Pantoea tagorei]
MLMGYFLNGLIFFRRGKSEEMPAPSIERRMNNNIFYEKAAYRLRSENHRYSGGAG